METIIALDQAAFIALNTLRHHFLDAPMRFITGTQTWFPFYALLLIWLIYQFRWQAVRLLIVIAVSITAADQFASTLMKPLIKRLRPCYEPALMQKVQLLDGCGGEFGFISSHAANTFALAMLMYFILKPFKYHKKATLLFFMWAIIVAYSRIYAGVHYPLDLLAGAGAGMLIAVLMWKINQALKFQN